MKKREEISTIYTAALSVFAEFGFKKATVEDIASSLGMSKGNLYLYTKSKRELYQRTVAFALLRWQGMVVKSVEAESEAKRKFMVMCQKAVEYLAGDRDLMRLLARDPEIFPMFTQEDPFEEINRASKELIQHILEQGIEEGTFHQVDTDRISEVFFSIYKMFVIRVYLKEENQAVLKMYEDTVDLLTTGLFVREK
jgi:AcrR family transcriptional regulator